MLAEDETYESCFFSFLTDKRDGGEIIVFQSTSASQKTPNISQPFANVGKERSRKRREKNAAANWQK